MNHLGNPGLKHTDEAKAKIALHLKEKRMKNADSYFTITESRIKGQFLRKLLIEMEYRKDCCEICGQLPEWNGTPLVLQVDHKNGNSCDNRVDNLVIICPNCHSQTETFAGRNVKVFKNQYTKLDVDGSNPSL